jgi:OmpA-OmpF porin, OOP family
MKRIILAVAAAVSCNAALAADTDTYVNASLGVAEQKVTAEGMSLSDDGIGAQIAAGYRFTPNVGIEWGFTTLGTASVSGNGGALSGKPRAFHVAATGSLNVSRAFAITGKLGVARTRTKVDVSIGRYSESARVSETSLLVGVGASFAVTPNVALIAEYQNFGKIANEENVNLKASMISAGVRFNF